MTNDNWLNLDKKVAIVTGGAKGIGRAIAIRFAKAGAKLVIADIDMTGAQQVRDEIKKSGGQAFATLADISNEASVNSMVDFTIKNCGQIDILINNAGIAGKAAPLHELTEKDWDTVMNVNL